MCSFQFNGICFQRKQVWIDSFSMPGALHCTNVKNRSLLVLTILHSGFVGGTTEDVKTNFTCSKFWVCSASSMRVKTCVHRTAPSASWQPLCRKFFFVKCLEMFANSHLLQCVAFRWHQSTWALALAQLFTFLLNVTLRLCSQSSANRRLRRKHGSRIFVFNIVKNKLSCVLFKSSWQAHPRLQNPCLSWRYLYFCNQSSCRFENVDSCHWPDR